jgi:cation:H+ antiporter
MELSAGWIWIAFAACLAVTGYAGVKLSRYGDIIAEKTGWGGTWVGLVLVASVTSLPELVTGVTAVTAAKAPDIAVGDVLGSCVFNLLIIVVLDFLHRGESIYARAHQSHVLSGSFGIVLIGFAGFNILVAEHGSRLALGHVGAYSPVILVLYAIAMRTVFQYERLQPQRLGEEASRYPNVPLSKAVLRYGIAAAAVIAAGAALPFVGKQIAVQMGWHESFVGTLFVAFVTSVPEVVVTISALRLGAIDMAIGNLFGSNLFDIAIIAVDDLFYLPGPLLASVAPSHAVSALSAVMMTGVALIGLLYHPRKRVLRTVGWGSLLLLSLYLLNALALYLYGA